MIGTFVNMGTIILGSIIGGLVKKVLKDEYSSCLFTAMGLAATGLGINAVVQNMPNSNYPVLFIASLAAGSLIGNMLRIDERVSALTERRKARCIRIIPFYSQMPCLISSHPWFWRPRMA